MTQAAPSSASILHHVFNASIFCNMLMPKAASRWPLFKTLTRCWLFGSSTPWLGTTPNAPNQLQPPTTHATSPSPLPPLLGAVKRKCTGVSPLLCSDRVWCTASPSRHGGKLMLLLLRDALGENSGLQLAKVFPEACRTHTWHHSRYFHSYHPCDTDSPQLAVCFLT